MQSAQTEFDTTRQTAAEIDALRQLWSTVIPRAAPNPEAIGVWLQRLTFFEVGKCVHATQLLHRKYDGKLRPWQLHIFMEQCVNKALKENYGTDSE